MRGNGFSYVMAIISPQKGNFNTSCNQTDQVKVKLKWNDTANCPGFGLVHFNLTQ